MTLVDCILLVAIWAARRVSHYYCFACHGADEAEFNRIAAAKVPPYSTCDLCGREGKLARSHWPSHWQPLEQVEPTAIARSERDNSEPVKMVVAPNSGKDSEG